jgi:DNA-nicking Smr family endonuclease
VRNRRDLTPDDTAIWGFVARTVKPYPGRLVPPKPQGKPTQSAPSASGQAIQTATVPPKKPKLAPPLLAHAGNHRRVRRGALDIDGRIDLHGMTQAVAKPTLAAFLRNLSANHGRCALVITGKGRPNAIIDDYYAPPPGVLRRSFPEWLNDPALSPLIAGWAPAHPKHGGSGAFYVLLKRAVKK